MGREGSHINVLHDLFGNTSLYLDLHTVRKRRGREDGDGDKYKGGRRHTGAVTVRPTLHWHLHPICALAYTTSASGGGPQAATLLSGVEESVLITCQLDHNFHSLPNFVSHVG